MIDDQEIRAIAFLTARCRPSSATRWNEAGIAAKVREVAHLDLGTVIIAAIQAAQDRDAATPGVIPGPGPHWRNPETAPRPTPNVAPLGSRCTVCSETEERCRRLWTGDHEFERPRPRNVDLEPVVTELKGLAASTTHNGDHQ